ncbi:MAG: OmpH family outer membrane protein [Desulfohalobiaceae bacterium]|nr:OmpH family outer membrane protein [Desulfohalobiaceae bacterium]
MRKIVFFSLVIVLFFALPVLAKDLKIGVVDVQEVMEKSKPGEAALSKLKASFDEMKAELDSRKEDVDKLRQEIQKQSLVLSQEAQIDKETEYKQKVRDFRGLQQSYQKKMQVKEEKLTKPILEELKKVIEDFGQDEDYTLILNKQNSGVIFQDSSVDITDRIVRELNRAWSKK